MLNRLYCGLSCVCWLFLSRVREWGDWSVCLWCKMSCFGGTEDEALKAQRRQNKMIDQQLKKDKKSYRALHRLLLLGNPLSLPPSPSPLPPPPSPCASPFYPYNIYSLFFSHLLPTYFYFTVCAAAHWAQCPCPLVYIRFHSVLCSTASPLLSLPLSPFLPPCPSPSLPPSMSLSCPSIVIHIHVCVCTCGGDNVGL